MSATRTTHTAGTVSVQAGHDGLCDEHGPIPAFGPARTDEQGRVVMSDEEWDARRAAAARALKAVEQVTDETDTDEVWADVFRGLERAS